MAFADNLKRICAAQGTTPTALCKKLRVSTSRVTRWNNGALPKQDMLVRLAGELGCTVQDFFDSGEAPCAPPAPAAPAPAVPQNDDEQDILRVYRLLDRRARHEFMAMVYSYEDKAAK